jgi:hypothetical protein
MIAQVEQLGLLLLQFDLRLAVTCLGRVALLLTGRETGQHPVETVGLGTPIAGVLSQPFGGLFDQANPVRVDAGVLVGRFGASEFQVLARDLDIRPLRGMFRFK